MVIERRNSFYIFGAHSRAQTFAEYMKVLYPENSLCAYIVDNDEENLTGINGVPVIRLDRNGNIADCGIRTTESDKIFLAVRGVFHAVVSERLKEYGFSDIVPVTPELDIELRNRYMKKIFLQQGRSFVKADELISDEDIHENKNNVCVYVAKSAVDRPLGKDVPLMEYERIIQVGHALADQDIADCDVFDDTDENISLRNRQFSELTGLYWLWKNAKDDVIGLEHYRRRFNLQDGWQMLFEKNECDVILPVPLYVAPDLQDNYLFRHDHRPWEVMMRLVKTNKTMYDAAVEFFLSNGCFSPCNMMIVKREVLNDLCSWLFPVLFGVANEVGILNDPYQNRYCGFLSERMISFFFFFYKNRYKVVYADKNFLG